MLNEVVLEGIVVKSWKYADDLFFRLVCYRDPDIPPKPILDGQETADYVTVRVPRAYLGGPVSVEKGFHVRVHGFIQSRDYIETLVDFLKDARGAEVSFPPTLDLGALHAPRATTEVVARRIMNQPAGSRRVGM
ncbi:MAG: hypothetical protein PHQ40_07755 [Anaerolineaceae bacterium]|nr:hypothetical protein [Anaerolineaceae bacterium]